MTATKLTIAISGPSVTEKNFIFRGYLQESEDGTGLSNQPVHLSVRRRNVPWPQQRCQTANTNQDGEYTFQTNQADPGVYEYRAEFDGALNPANRAELWESTVSDSIKVRVRKCWQTVLYRVISVLCVAATIVLIWLAQGALHALVPGNIAALLSLLVPIAVIAIALFYNAWLISGGTSNRNIICGFGFGVLLVGAAILFALFHAGTLTDQLVAWLFLIATTAVFFFGFGHVCMREYSSLKNIFDTLGFASIFAGAVYFALTGIYINRLASWLLLMLALSVLLFYLGPIVFSAVGKRRLRGLDWYGVLVDKNNRVSVVRFQVVVWTVLTLATFAEAALANVAAGAQNPVFIVEIPNNLWLLLGISVTTLPATLLATIPNTRADEPRIDEVIATRKAKEQSAEVEPEVDKSKLIIDQAISDTNATKKELVKVRVFKVKQPNGDIETIVSHGITAARPRVEDARLKDMFTGDEINNYGYVDPSKVQLFFFNMILVLVYGVAIGSFLYQFPPIYTTLPNVPDALAVFLGISNGAFLTYKAIP
ncbi:MAG: hypothetical protein ACXV3D_04745 [Halobacteriota archaeon]